jgi:hypothetical protein
MLPPTNRAAAQTWAIDEEANQKAKGATLSPAGPPTGTPSVVKSLSESGPLPTPVASAASFFTVSFVMIDLLILQNLRFAGVWMATRHAGTLNIAITARIAELRVQRSGSTMLNALIAVRCA